MIINKSNLAILFTAFKAAFNAGFGRVQSQYQRIATVVKSTTASESYGWLGSFPKMREWIGDRVINAIKQHNYTIRNKPFELTVSVPRDDIDDDQYGVYKPMMEELGLSASEHPDELVFNLLKAGPSTVCYDGQYFFDTDHPVIDETGAVVSQSNWDNNSGSGTAWYLLCTKRALKPIIFQDRKQAQFVSKTAPTDDNVFDRAEYVYGVDSRCNVGYGFWQMAFGSRKALDEANLTAAWAAFCERKGDNGRVLGLKPDLLVVPPSLEIAAKKLVSAATFANGAENVMKGLVDVISDPRLA